MNYRKLRSWWKPVEISEEEPIDKPELDEWRE
jgi:hypothetical protein